MKKLILISSLLICQLSLAQESIIGRNSAPLFYLEELAQEQEGGKQIDTKVRIYFLERCTALTIYMFFAPNVTDSDYYSERRTAFLATLALVNRLSPMSKEFENYIVSLKPIIENYDQEYMALQRISDDEYCDGLHNRLKDIKEVNK